MVNAPYAVKCCALEGMIINLKMIYLLFIIIFADLEFHTLFSEDVQQHIMSSILVDMLLDWLIE